MMTLISHLVPYDALPELPPATDLETSRVLKACIRARSEVAALRLADRIVPNAEIMINTLPVLESRASSEIENIVTTNDALFRSTALDNQFDDEEDRKSVV